MAVTPHQAATDVLDRADALLTLDSSKAALPIREDVRRACLAMGMAAIDTQMHWLIARADLKSTLPGALANLPISFGDLVKADHAAVDARRTSANHRPASASRRVLMSAISWRSFQRADKLAEGLRMVNLKLDDVAAAMVPAEPAKDVRKRLDKLADRRNAIVHEGDIAVKQRPHSIKRAAITAKGVAADLAWIRRFLVALDTLS